MRTHYRRKRFWIVPSFQGRLLLQIGSYFLLYLLIICFLGVFVFIHEALASNHLAGGFELYGAYLASLRPVFLAALLLMPYFIYDSIKFSNRIAGPMYRCQKTMREMAEGKPVPEFVPRPRDLMPDFFVDFNSVIRAWNSCISAQADKSAACQRSDEMPAHSV